LTRIISAPRRALVYGTDALINDPVLQDSLASIRMPDGRRRSLSFTKSGFVAYTEHAGCAEKVFAGLMTLVAAPVRFDLSRLRRSGALRASPDCGPIVDPSSVATAAKGRLMIASIQLVERSQPGVRLYFFARVIWGKVADEVSDAAFYADSSPRDVYLS
jgi:hypothetical protein